MARKLIKQLPPLGVVAFLFPKREFYDTHLVNIRFRVYLERGELRMDWRRVGDPEWWQAPAAFKLARERNQRAEPHRYYFTTPVEVDDDEPPNPSHPRTSGD